MCMLFAWSCIHLNVPWETGDPVPLVTAAGSGVRPHPSSRRRGEQDRPVEKRERLLATCYSRWDWTPTPGGAAHKALAPPAGDKRGGDGKARATILFMGLHRSVQIPPRRNKNANWIYWIQGVCLNETLPSFVFWFGRMMHRFLHGNPLYTFCSLPLIVLSLSMRCLLPVKYLKSNTDVRHSYKDILVQRLDMFIKWTWINPSFW